MPKYFFRWLVTSLAVFMVPHIVSGIHIEGVAPALAVAAVLGLLNVLLRPILVILTLPLTVFSFGFFILILNAFLFQLAASFVSGFQVDTFGSAFLASLSVSLISWVLNLGFKRHDGGVQWYVHKGGNGKISNTRDLN